MSSNHSRIMAIGLAVLSALQIAAQSLSPVKTEALPGEVTVQTLPNGNKVKFFPYGKAAFGNAVLIYPNGNTIKGTYTVLATGERRANFPYANELDILPEGTTTSHLSNGFIAEFFPNGQSTLIVPGHWIFTVQSKNLPNGDTMLMLPGGNDLEIDPGGKTTLILTSGERVEGDFDLGADGSTITTLPTGSKIERFPSGREDVTLRNGYNIEKSLDGTVSMDLRSIGGEASIKFTLSPGLATQLVLPGSIIFNIPSSWIVKDGSVSNHLVIVCGCRFRDFWIRAIVPYDGKNGDGLPQIERAFLPPTVPFKGMPGITQPDTAKPGSPLAELIDKNCKNH
ncbi:MAG: hypothetical protein ACLQG3_00950 [Terracidiphilus sp.]